jgi:hypothetical protein
MGILDILAPLEPRDFTEFLLLLFNGLDFESVLETFEASFFRAAETFPLLLSNDPVLAKAVVSFFFCYL